MQGSPASVPFENRAKACAILYCAVLAVTWAEPVEWPAPKPLPAGLTEDIGTFETYEPKPFAAPKPGLKSKRSSGRGRGVMGAVLAADESVTHEQSRML